MRLAVLGCLLLLGCGERAVDWTYVHVGMTVTDAETVMGVPTDTEKVSEDTARVFWNRGKDPVFYVVVRQECVIRTGWRWHFQVAK